MRRLCPAVLALALLFPACGGGGSAGTGGAPQVLGKVTRRTGSAAGLAGVLVSCDNNGAFDVTGADGSFSFEVPSGAKITVRVQDGTLPTAGGDWNCEESDDATDDSLDASEDEVELEPLADGEVIRVEIELENGTIVECWLDGEGDDDGLGECPLLPDPVLAPGARGELEVVRDGDCLDLELEVAGLDGAQPLEVVLLTPRGEHALGTLEVGADGVGHFVGRVCVDDLPDPPSGMPGLPAGLPAGLPEELDDLLDGLLPPTIPEFDPFAGSILLLVNADGAVVFVGFLPGPGSEAGDGWNEPGEGWEDGIGGGELPDLGDLPPGLDDLFDLPELPHDLGDTLADLLAPFLPH